MHRAWEGWLAGLIGAAVAALMVAAVYGAMRLAAALRALLSGPQHRAMRRLARLRGIRVRQARAGARAEGRRTSDALAEVERLRLALRMVTAERDAALAALTTRPPAPRRWFGRPRPGPEEKFQQAKRAFALRFHPDRPGIDPRERQIRATMFREFWQELRQIERR